MLTSKARLVKPSGLFEVFLLNVPLTHNLVFQKTCISKYYSHAVFSVTNQIYRNEQKRFSEGVGLAESLGLAASGSSLKAAPGKLLKTDNCVLIPTETAGPFPLDLTANTTFFRQDIHETEAGVQLNVKA
ncbi:MAG: hypothetical protein R3B47_15895 [Bacteroidia bacterium]